MPDHQDQISRLELATEFAQNRRCKVDAFEHIAPTLGRQWQYCQNVLANIRGHLSPLQQNNPGIACVTVAGSYGRMEAAELSDLDLLVMVEDTISQSKADAKHCVTHVWELLEPLGLRRPEAGGLFMLPMARPELCDPQARGNLEYPKHVFGQRMQLLLDAQPVFGDQNHIDVLHQIIDWYTDDAPSHPIWHPAQYALHDLIRYFRSYSVMHQFDSRFAENDSWWLRQIKMHHSRTMSYLGLMLILTTIEGINGLNEPIQPQKLVAALTLTPLERVNNVLFRYDDRPMKEIAALYDQVQARLVSEDCRSLLLSQSRARDQEAPLIFDELMKDCGHLRKCLTSAVINHQQNLPASIQSMLIL